MSRRGSTLCSLSTMSTEKLIELVYRHPELYDKNHIDFRKLQKKQQLWKTVARQLGSRNGDQMKRKWKNLRDTYARYLRISSEEGSSTKRWIWSEKMEIFRPFVPLGSSSAEVTGPEPGSPSPETGAESEDSAHEEEEAAAQESELRSGCPPTHPQHEMITCDLDVGTEAPTVPKPETDRLSFQEQLPASTEEVCVPPGAKMRAATAPTEPQAPVITYLESRAGTDEIDSLFLAYATTVKKFSPRRQVMTKLKLAQLIAEEELAHLDETDLLATQTFNHSTLP
ncbi:transcription factor Adf-1-like [Schistocerca serialis cubense]|uniref:transcription factor Adf-1-like n=1 Tax=Schistocerca serialis cubense TaxID=2023355 RepID=UPI00214E92B6|nr:transcription factor Adf-1-like [Schistocerca serialis cubense]